MTKAGEHIQNLALLWMCVSYAIGGYERKSHFARELDGSFVARFLVASAVPLQLHIDVRSAESINQPLEAIWTAVCVSR